MTVAMDSEQDGPETGGGDREGSSGWDRPARQIAMRGFAQFRVVSARMDVPNPEEHCNVSRFSPELSQIQFCYFQVGFSGCLARHVGMEQVSVGTDSSWAIPS